MSSKQYEVAVAYRIYPRVSKSPAMFPDDKLRLGRLCLQSFRASLGTVRAKMFVLLDGCPPEFDQMFTECFDAEDLELVRLDGVGNRQTFLRQIEILLNQECAEAVYFAEDDYFYLPDEFRLMLNLMCDGSEVDFISPYDHPDYYSLALHSGRQLSQSVGDRNWRTAASTCLTFLTSKKMLADTKGIFRSYARGNPDVSLWLSLTKQAILDPGIIRRSFQERIAHGGFLAISWMFGWPQILAGQRRKLWVPSPSIATHMEQKFLAPGVDWNVYFERARRLA